ncbi:MAG: DNA primase [Bacteroides sp.]|jgi:DNA primase|nr:DNA primase [Bacteroides sp.]
MITPDTKEKIMDAVRIEEVVGEFVNLKKRGVNLIGLCPFHNEKTPSFNVNPARGIFKCFGCGKGGDAVSFLMEHEHYTFPEALKYLANKYGIEIEEEKPSPEQQQAMDEKESLFNLSAFAQKYFEDILHKDEEGKAIGMTYLKERGFSLETIRKFGLGYALNQWDAFTLHAKKHGYKKEYLLNTSLSKEKDQQLYDSFRGRVIFPIHNLSGRVLGFGARILTSEKNKPKYINTAESDIYHKSKVLYGLYFAKSAVSREDNCYLVEGYTDVISMHQAGIENVISSSGTSLTTEQIKLIRRYTSNITLLFDGDPAGIKAAFRGIDMILEEGMNVRLVLFPDGEDPDSYARKYRPVEVKAFVEKNALDFISFKTNLLLGETQNDPIRKAGLIKEIAQTISLIPEPIARTLYIQQCSDLMQIDERLLVAEVNKLRRQKATRDRSNEPPQKLPEPRPELPVQQETQKLTNGHQEKEVIRMLLQHGGKKIEFEVADEAGKPMDISIRVVDFIIDDFSDDKLGFDNPACQTIFDIFARHRLEDTIPSEQAFFSHEEQSVRDLAIDLMSTPHTLSDNWKTRHRIFVKTEEENLKQSLLEVLYAFKLRRLEKMIEENQERLKICTDEEEANQLLENDRQLKAKRSLFAKELSRIITR